MTSRIFGFRSFLTAVIGFALTGVLLFSVSSDVIAQKKKPAARTAATKTTPAARAVSSASVSGKCSGSRLTLDETNQALAVHNFDRSAHNLAPLKWDCRLATMAQEWANRSVFEHRDTPYGENLYVGADTNATMNMMIDMWLAEKVFWNNKDGKCAAGKTCGHYTQIVWKATARVGCGINRNASGNWKVMFVCNYDPSGNTSGPAY